MKRRRIIQASASLFLTAVTLITAPGIPALAENLGGGDSGQSRRSAI